MKRLGSRLNVDDFVSVDRCRVLDKVSGRDRLISTRKSFVVESGRSALLDE